MPVKVIVLDIEGTTTSISFVKDNLFSYAVDHVKEYLCENWTEASLQEIVKELREQYVIDETNKIEGAVPISSGEGKAQSDQIAEIVENVKWQISNDRKTTSLKKLQGQIWAKGYSDGSIKGHVYPDVPKAFERWVLDNIKIYIYSSGSVNAQKLLFANSEHGDLTPKILDYFDTTIGAKQEKSSYEKIVQKVGCDPCEILFLTDIVNEAVAAKQTGIQVAILDRSGNSALTDEEKAEYQVLTSFDEVNLEFVSGKRKLDDILTDETNAVKVAKLSDDEAVVSTITNTETVPEANGIDRTDSNSDGKMETSMETNVSNSNGTDVTTKLDEKTETNEIPIKKTDCDLSNKINNLGVDVDGETIKNGEKDSKPLIIDEVMKEIDALPAEVVLDKTSESQLCEDVEMKVAPNDTEAKSATVDSEAKSAPVDTEAKSDIVDTEAKSDIVDTDAKSDTIDTEAKSDKIVKEGKSDKIVKEGKSDTIDTEAKSDTIDKGVKADTTDTVAKSAPVDTEPKSATMEIEAKPATTDTEAKTDIIDKDATSATMETEAKSNRIETEAKSATMETEVKSDTIETEAKTAITETEAKSVTIDTEAKSVTIDTEAKSVTIETEAKSATMEEQESAKVNDVSIDADCEPVKDEVIVNPEVTSEVSKKEIIVSENKSAEETIDKENVEMTDVSDSKQNGDHKNVKECDDINKVKLQGDEEMDCGDQTVTVANGSKDKDEINNKENIPVDTIKEKENIIEIPIHIDGDIQSAQKPSIISAAATNGNGIAQKEDVDADAATNSNKEKMSRIELIIEEKNNDNGQLTQTTTHIVKEITIVKKCETLDNVDKLPENV